MPKVVVVGDANVDIIVPYPRFLNEERTQVEYPQIGIEGGGTSANTAVALAKLGLDVSFVGTVGDDQYGRFVMQDFKDAGVDVTGLVADSTLSTVGVFAFVDDRGERYLWGWPRERQSFKVLDENLVPMHMIREADWVHSSGMCLTYDTSARETIIRIFEQAHDAGVPTSFDLNLRVKNMLPSLYREDPEFYENMRIQELAQNIHKLIVHHNLPDLMYRAFEVLPTMVMTPYAAFQKELHGMTEEVYLDEMVGRINANMILPYPPGVPLVMPGEMITEESRPVLEFLQMLCEIGAHYPGFETDIHGAYRQADGRYTVKVLKEESKK